MLDFLVIIHSVQDLEELDHATGFVFWAYFSQFEIIRMNLQDYL